ncbi:probable pre-mRNA-splicing factor ATP-dependent RNA helicase DEAH4 [Tanacetum coccineum]
MPKKLPLEPSLARTLIEANKNDCLPQALTVAAMLSVEGTLLPGRSKHTDKKRKQPPSELPDGSGWGDHIQLLQIYKLWDQTNYSSDWVKDNLQKFAKDIILLLCSIFWANQGAGEAAEEGRQSVWVIAATIDFVRGACVKGIRVKFLKGMVRRKCEANFRAENAEDLDSPASGIKANGGDSSDNEATSSVIGSGTNNMQRSGVFSFSDNREGIKRSAGGDIAPTTRHYRSFYTIDHSARMSLRSRCEGVAGINTLMSVMGINLKSLHSEPCIQGLLIESCPSNPTWKSMRIAQMMKNEFPNQDLSILDLLRCEMGRQMLELERIGEMGVVKVLDSPSFRTNFLVMNPGFFHRRVRPPHLYPFVDAEVEGYVTEYVDTTKRLQAIAIYIPLSGWLLSHHLEYLDWIL